MNLGTWAERKWCCAGDGVSLVSRWPASGAGPAGGPVGSGGRADRRRGWPRRCTAVYARVSSADQRADLDRQVARVTAWATAQQIPVDKVVTEVGSARSGHRRKFLALLGDPRWVALWSSIGIGSAGSDRSMFKPRWLRRAESLWCSIQLRSMTTWCGI